MPDDDRDDVLGVLTEMREHIHYLVEHVTAMVQSLTDAQAKIDALVAAVLAEQATGQSILATLQDLASETGALATPRRRRDIVQ